jgi:general secretion pathway protein A
MYESFFGLREQPFELSGDSPYVLLTPGHTEALCYLRDAAPVRGGMALIVGESGTGKTTLLRQAMRALGGSPSRVRLIEAPAVDRDELVAQIEAAIGLVPSASRWRLHQGVAQRLQETPGGIGLLFDEAQGLSDQLLEEIRLLSNVETATGRRMALVLVGQPELGARLREPKLASLKQRIGARFVLQPLSLQDTGAYIAARVSLAGGDAARIFAADAVRAIHGASRGVPRVVSIICHNALVAGFGAQRRPVDAALVAEVCGDLDLAVLPSAAAAPPPPAPRPAAFSSRTHAAPPASAPPSAAPPAGEMLAHVVPETARALQAGAPDVEPAGPTLQRPSIFGLDSEKREPAPRGWLRALFGRGGARRSSMGTHP